MKTQFLYLTTTSTQHNFSTLFVHRVQLSQLNVFDMLLMDHNTMHELKQRMAYAIVCTGLDDQFEYVNVIYHSCVNCGVERDDWFPNRIGMRMYLCTRCTMEQKILDLDISELEKFHRSLISQSTIDYINQRSQRLTYVQLRTNYLYISFHPAITELIKLFYKGDEDMCEIVRNYVLNTPRK